jgi:hypothetical protein
MLTEDAVTKLKLKLLPEKLSYGFSTDEALDAAIEKAFEISKMKYLIPALSEPRYDELADKDGENLTIYEKPIIEAELNFAVSCFLSEIAAIEIQRKSALSESKSFKGSSTAGNGIPGKSVSAEYFLKEAFLYLSMAGYERRQVYTKFGLIEEWDYLLEEKFI